MVTRRAECHTDYQQVGFSDRYAGFLAAQEVLTPTRLLITQELHRPAGSNEPGGHWRRGTESQKGSGLLKKSDLCWRFVG